MRNLLLAAGCLGAMIAPGLADPAITTAPSAMRRAANVHSRVVQVVPANAGVEIRSCGGRWCYGSWRGRHGYLPAFAVAQGGPPPSPPVGFSSPPPPLAVTAPVVVAPAPVYHWGGAYVGFGGGDW